MYRSRKETTSILAINYPGQRYWKSSSSRWSVSFLSDSLHSRNRFERSARDVDRSNAHLLIYRLSNANELNCNVPHRENKCFVACSWRSPPLFTRGDQPIATHREFDRRSFLLSPVAYADLIVFQCWRLLEEETRRVWNAVIYSNLQHQSI